MVQSNISPTDVLLTFEEPFALLRKEKLVRLPKIGDANEKLSQVNMKLGLDEMNVSMHQWVRKVLEELARFICLEQECVEFVIARVCHKPVYARRRHLIEKFGTLVRVFLALLLLCPQLCQGLLLLLRLGTHW